jgi:flagellar hook-associated protein 2
MSSIDGLITGIDTAKVVEGLLAIQKSQVDRLNVKKKNIVNEQAAFKGLEAKVIALRSSLARLAKSRDGVFDQRSATSSNEDNLQVTALSNGVSGQFTLRVQQLAKAEQFASQTFNDPDTLITHGSITFQVGSRPAVTIDVDSQNDTIQGLANSINAATTDLQATVINNGSTSRLLLSSKFTGAANSVAVTNNLAASGGSATKVDFTGPPVQAAADAIIEFGSGAGAITINSETNQVEQLIEGVTLNLLKADANEQITINIKRDTQTAKEAIQDFVDDYNALSSLIDEQTKYIPETNQAGILQGNSVVRTIQNEVRSLLSSSVAAGGGSLKNLSAIGIQFNDKGQLTINEAKLDKVLSGQQNGATIDDVKKLFSLTGTTTNQKVEFLFGSSRTVSGPNKIQVDITQAASRATVLGTNTLNSSIVVDGSNNTFSFKIDKQESGTLTLPSGTYTQSEFADLVEKVINENPGTNAKANVSIESGRLRIESTKYGSDSQLSDFSGTALTAFGFDGSETHTGNNVAGSFIVNGQLETATGRGRLLTGDQTNANTADLQLRILLKPSEVIAGVESELVISRGYAAKLDKTLEKLLDPVNGRFKFTNEGYERNLESIDDSIDLVEKISAAKQEYLLAQFRTLESAVSSLQSVGNLLATQLTSFGTKQ